MCAMCVCVCSSVCLSVSVSVGWAGHQIRTNCIIKLSAEIPQVSVIKIHILVLTTKLYHLVGFGVINTSSISLVDPSFMADPPSFTLIGDTTGGPPETSTWTRNGANISDGGSYNISLTVPGVTDKDLFRLDTQIFQQSRYRSILTVTGNLPGVYVYSVINRAMSAPRTASFTIEGIVYSIVGLVQLYTDLHYYYTNTPLYSFHRCSSHKLVCPTDWTHCSAGLLDCTNICSQWGVQDNCKLNRHQYWHRHHIISTHHNRSTTWCV